MQEEQSMCLLRWLLGSKVEDADIPEEEELMLRMLMDEDDEEEE